MCLSAVGCTNVHPDHQILVVHKCRRQEEPVQQAHDTSQQIIIIIYKPAIWHTASCQVSQCQGIHIYMHSLSHSLFKLVLSSSGVVWTQPAASTAGDSRPVWLLFCCTWYLLSFAMSFSVLCVSSHHMQQKTLFLLVCCVPFLPHVLHISWTAESTHGTMVSSVSWYPVLHC